MSHVTVELDANGRILMIEPEQRAGLDRRAFRQIGDHYEWCHLSDLRQNGPRARFYGWSSKDLPQTMTCGSTFPQHSPKPCGSPCGECHLASEETCDICGAIA